MTRGTSCRRRRAAAQAISRGAPTIRPDAPPPLSTAGADGGGSSTSLTGALELGTEAKGTLPAGLLDRMRSQPEDELQQVYDHAFDNSDLPLSVQHLQQIMHVTGVGSRP